MFVPPGVPASIRSAGEVIYYSRVTLAPSVAVGNEAAVYTSIDAMPSELLAQTTSRRCTDTAIARSNTAAGAAQPSDIFSGAVNTVRGFGSRGPTGVLQDDAGSEAYRVDTVRCVLISMIAAICALSLQYRCPPQYPDPTLLRDCSTYDRMEAP